MNQTLEISLSNNLNYLIVLLNVKALLLNSKKRIKCVVATTYQNNK